MTIIKAFFVFGFACFFVVYMSTGSEPYEYISFLQLWALVSSGTEFWPNSASFQYPSIAYVQALSNAWALLRHLTLHHSTINLKHTLASVQVHILDELVICTLHTNSLLLGYEFKVEYAFPVLLTNI